MILRAELAFTAYRTYANDSARFNATPGHSVLYNVSRPGQQEAQVQCSKSDAKQLLPWPLPMPTP